MRSMNRLAIIIVLLIIPTTLFGVAKGQTELSLAAGVGVPVGDFGDVAKTGYLLGANLGFYTNPQFCLGGELNYYGFGASDDLVAAAEGLFYLMTGMSVDVDINWSVFNAAGYLKYLFTDGNFTPYIKGRGGYYSLGLKVSAAGEEESESEGYFGFGMGLGAQFQGQGRVGGFFEGLYNNIFADGDDVQFFEIRGGVNILMGG